MKRIGNYFFTKMEKSLKEKDIKYSVVDGRFDKFLLIDINDIPEEFDFGLSIVDRILYRIYLAFSNNILKSSNCNLNGK